MTTEGFDAIIAEISSSPRRMTVAELSRRLRVHRSTIEALCRNHGLTFLQMRQRIWFVRACRLLLDPDSTIKNVALSCGYTQSAFSRFVSSQSQLSPTALREQLQNGRFRIPDLIVGWTVGLWTAPIHVDIFEYWFPNFLFAVS